MHTSILTLQKEARYPAQGALVAITHDSTHPPWLQVCLASANTNSHSHMARQGKSSLQALLADKSCTVSMLQVHFASARVWGHSHLGLTKHQLAGTLV